MPKVIYVLISSNNAVLVQATDGQCSDQVLCT